MPNVCLAGITHKSRARPPTPLDGTKQSERRLLVGEYLHSRMDADELLRVVDADTSFPAATRTWPDSTSAAHRADCRKIGRALRLERGGRRCWRPGSRGVRGVGESA